MSYWYEAKPEDIVLGGDEINIYAGYDDNGNRYATVKVPDLLKALRFRLESIVPEERGVKKEDHLHNVIENVAYNHCREEVLSNIKKLLDE